MKKHLTTFLLTCLLFLNCNLQAQQINKCGTTLYMQQLLQQKPQLETKMQADELLINQEVIRLSSNRTSMTTYVIPVVVHVVWNSAAENISIAQVQSQIDVLNEDFSRTNADTINTPLAFQSVAGNPQIQFCLAQHDPNGNPTTGIEYTQTPVTSFTSTTVRSASTGGADAWDEYHYLNIWVCNLTGGFMGTGIMPGTGNAGAVIHYMAFGRMGPLFTYYNLGRTTTHSIGHCFNLRHVWGDEPQCTGSDLVSDTPNQTDNTFGCPVYPTTDTCSPIAPGIMFMNFMDYSDDACMNLFTQGQSLRMAAAINIYYSTLISSTSCSTLSGVNQTKGAVFYDANQNGVQDANDIGIANQKVYAMPDSDLYFTDYHGNYTLFLDTGSNYSVGFIPKQSWSLTSSPSLFSFTTSPGSYCCYNFGTLPNTVFDSARINLSHAKLRCDTVVPYWINIFNEGTMVDSGIVRFTYSDSVSFVYAVPPPDVILSDTLIWNYDSLQPGEARIIWIVMHTVPTDSVTVCTDAFITSFNSAITDADTSCSDIVCSFDPNDKSVSPPGILAQHYTLKNSLFEYTIRFQNSGSDTAYSVVIIDTLNQLYDFASFNITGFSHPVITSLNNQHIATFRLDNIILPPASINEAQSQGFVSYAINPLPGLPDGTVIDNSAAIFFDSNAPVITNNVFNTLVTVLPTQIDETHISSTFIVYPNPASDVLYVICDNVQRITITNLLGEIVIDNKIDLSNKERNEVDISSLSQGMYFIKVGNKVRKFLKK